MQNTHHSLSASTKHGEGVAVMLTLVGVRVVWCSIARNSCKLAVWILADADRVLLCLRTLVCTAVASLCCCSLGLHVLAGMAVPPALHCPSFSLCRALFHLRLQAFLIWKRSPSARFHTANPWAPWLLFLVCCLCRQLFKCSSWAV